MRTSAKIACSVTACFFLLLACNKQSSSIPTNTNTEPTTQTPSQQKLLDLVNASRSQGCNCGKTYYPPVAALVWNDDLENAAKKHSEYMNRTGKFSHTGENNSNAGERISAEGYQWISYGENIASGYSTEEAVIEGWLRSEGHCRNIMNGKYTEMGVATSGNYWTQIFASK